jgi:hypothetical protein
MANFEKPFILALIVVTSSLGLAQSVTGGSGPADAMTTFRQFVRRGQIDRSTLVRQTSLVHVNVKKGDKIGTLVLRRLQDPNHGIQYQEVVGGEMTGDQGLVQTYRSRGNKKENDRYLNCVKDPAWCRTMALSEANYDVVSMGDVESNGILAAHYLLKPKQKIEGMSNCELWINKQTFHVVREVGQPVGLPKGVAVSFDRVHGEQGEDSVPLREQYVTKIVVVGTYVATLDYSDIKIERRACDARCEAEARAVSGLAP